jgi:hypothetical protein
MQGASGMYVCMHVRKRVQKFMFVHVLYVYIYACVRASMRACMPAFTCMYGYICMYVWIHTYVCMF